MGAKIQKAFSASNEESGLTNYSATSARHTYESQREFYIDDPKKVLTKKALADLELNESDFKTQLLRDVFKGNLGETLDGLRVLKSTLTAQQFEHEVLFAFWFAVHMEHLLIVQALVNLEPIVKKYVAGLLVSRSFKARRGATGETSMKSSKNSSGRKWPEPKKNQEYGDECITSHEFAESEGEVDVEQLEKETSVKGSSSSKSESEQKVKTDTSSSSEGESFNNDETSNISSESQDNEQEYQIRQFEGGDEETAKKLDNNSPNQIDHQANSAQQPEQNASQFEGQPLIPQADPPLQTKKTLGQVLLEL